MLPADDALAISLVCLIASKKYDTSNNKNESYIISILIGCDFPICSVDGAICL